MSEDKPHDKGGGSLSRPLPPLTAVRKGPPGFRPIVVEPPPASSGLMEQARHDPAASKSLQIDGSTSRADAPEASEDRSVSQEQAETGKARTSRHREQNDPGRRKSTMSAHDKSLVRIQGKVTKDIAKKFRLYCVQREKSMESVINEFIEKTVGNWK